MSRRAGDPAFPIFLFLLYFSLARTGSVKWADDRWAPAVRILNINQTVFFIFSGFLKWQILGQTLEGHIFLKNNQKNMNLFAVALF